MKKFSFLSFYIFLSVSLSFFSLNFYFFWSIDFFKNFFDFMLSFPINFSMEKSNLIFLFMVCLVTTLVALYSEAYMESYNNKKFLALMFLFWLSMLILSLSGGSLMMMVGWDGLGISSLCLIMFYPNKTSLFNSFLTMFFNRVGDVLMVFILVFLVFSSTEIFCLHNSDSTLFWFLVCLCAFTKSAQIPFSTWLPAAMSAPTPISAMVHSSTLVTGGIFLLHKASFYLISSQVFLFLLVFSALTFLAGSLMGNVEIDFKKIVAFSTMSQISMIMFMISLGLISLAVSHMFFHALFKTALFCCCGYIFSNIFMDQDSKNILSTKNSNILMLVFLFSVFSMSGLIFSSSFYTKDFLLEESLISWEMFIFLFMFFGSILSLAYSVKISGFLSSMSFPQYCSSVKNYFFIFFALFSILNLESVYLFKYVFILESSAVVSMFDFFLILMLINIPIIFMFSFQFKTLMEITLSVGLTKSFSFSNLSATFKNKSVKSLYRSDSFFFSLYCLYSELLLKMNLLGLLKWSPYSFLLAFILFKVH